MISRQAALNPDGVALAARDEVITHATLEERTNQLAQYLRGLNIGPNTLVAICMPRSTTFTIAALGVLKAGAAYLPLDPAYPLDHLAWTLNDARPVALLTQQRFSDRLPVGAWQTVLVDSESARIASHSRESFDSAAEPESLAYVIYTSGSTGRPKGVQITHGGLLNLVLWHQQEFGITPDDRASQVANLGFDAAVWEVWPYLASGSSVYVADEGIRNDPEALRKWLVSQQITVAFAPTPLAERMIELTWPKQVALRLLLTGGDTLHSYPPATLSFKLVNNYGPTECTVVATSGWVSPDGIHDQLPSIGRPISNVKIHILDERLQPVPLGTPGELYIGGAGVAAGYLNARELTEAKFVVDPFEPESKGRLFKTGDLGRHLPDGQIAFLGRADEQIKIRGYRIEPNEIATALLRHSTVQASAVVAREDTPGEKRLAAYVVPTPGTQPTDKLLREFLSSQLPDYMVPPVFVRIDALPLNANGKLDRAALPAPDESNSLRDDEYLAPRSAIEQRVAEVISELLGLEKVGVEDNFFMLGGHSLLGTQVIVRMRELFGVDLSLRSLFDSPTIADLAVEVERLLFSRIEGMSDEEAALFLNQSQIKECPSAR